MSIAAARRSRYSVPSVRASLGSGGASGRRSGSGWSLFGSSSDKSGGKSAASRIADYRPAPAKDMSSRMQQNGKAGNKYREKRAAFTFSMGDLGQGVTGVLALFGRLVLFASALLFLAAISIGLLMSYRWMTNLPYFNLQEIVVQGNARMTTDEVIAACGVDMGQNALALNIHDVENGLLLSPWVETASVKRVLPGRLEILLTERQPRFWVHKDDRLYYADESGQLIAPVDTDRFVSLPILEIAGEEIGHRLNMLPELAGLVNGKGLSFGGKGISWLRISARDGIEIYLDDYDVVLSTPLDDWKEGLVRIGKVWQDLQRRKEVAQIKSVRAAGSKVLVYKKA